MISSSAIMPNLIGGQWVSASSGRENINPSNVSDIIGIYAQATSDDVTSAVEAAHSAAQQWRISSPQVRADLLDHVGSALIARKAEYGRLLSREEGKTLAEGVAETARAGQIFKFFAQEALRIAGDSIASVRPGVSIEVTREPVGVVGIITPWNFPMAIPAWKIAPALAYGNTVVFKPADLTPACAHVLAELLYEAGCPAGVFNLVCGAGSVIGPALLGSDQVRAISFTGSVPVGQALAHDAVAGMKKFQLELGGKNPMVVMNDADLDTAVRACLEGTFFSTGQRCTGSSRLIVQSGIYDHFVERLTKAMVDLRVGDALDPQTEMGPVASEKQLLSNLAYVDIARAEGLEVVGGDRLDGATQGYFQRPGLFLGGDNDTRVAREEIFGPLATVIRVDDFDEAVAVANDTEFGLSAGICTSSLKQASEFKRLAEAGMVMVNLPTAGVDYHVPFGGRKASSYGPREQGRYAAEFYTTVKTAYTFSG